MQPPSSEGPRAALLQASPPRGQITFLPTSDLTSCDAFYRELLGLPLVRDQGLCRIYRTGPGAFLGLCERGYAVPKQHRVVITLLVDDVEDVYARAQAAGTACESAPAHSQAFRCTQFFVRDPNGYLVEVQRFDEPLPGT